MTFLQLQVTLPDDALAVTQCRFQIAPWQWQAKLKNCALAVASDAPKSHPGCCQEFYRISPLQWPMLLPNFVLAVANDTPEQHLGGGRE